MKLMYMANETGKAIAILHSKNTSFKERMKANAIIDAFSCVLKKQWIAWGMSIKETRELITGKYLMKK